MTQSMKYILVTGGTLSGVGKGVTASSLGVLLQSKGYPVTFIKIDPYINLDAGTLNPFDHGEVYVLEDGTEVDLDLGNYERFLDISLTGAHCITTGKIFDEIIKKEREGSFLGKTVQMIPHVTNLIKKKIKEASSMPIKMGVSFEKNNKTKPEICIIELGGTIGDIESLVFSESLRQIKREAGKNDFLIVTVEFLPQISNGELKTKPIQNSIRKSLSFGIKPDIIVCRSEINIDSSIKEKISNFCEVEIEDIFQSKTLNSVYDLPELLNSQGVFESVKKHLNLKNIVYEEELTNQILSCVNDTLNDTSEENKIKKNEIKNKKTNKKRNNKKIKKEINEEINEKIEKTPLINEPIPNNPNSLSESFLFFSCKERFVKLSKKYDTKIKVSIIGKYVGNNDCYLSLHNAIKFSAAHLQVDAVINWIEATDLEEKDVNELLSGSDCIIVPGGFGPRGVEGKIKAISYARTNNIPFLGICLGFQMAVVEFARNVLGIQKAHSEEFEKRDDNVVVYLNDYEQKSFGGTMRLGNKPTFLKDGRIKEWYKVKEKAYERHRHRYEVNTAMVDLFEEKGLEFVGKNEGNERMEVFDYKNNDFFIGVQFHPEFNARPNAPHCLFNQLLSYGLKKKNYNL